MLTPEAITPDAEAARYRLLAQLGATVSNAVKEGKMLQLDLLEQGPMLAAGGVCPEVPGDIYPYTTAWIFKAETPGEIAYAVSVNIGRQEPAGGSEITPAEGIIFRSTAELPTAMTYEDYEHLTSIVRGTAFTEDETRRMLDFLRQTKRITAGPSVRDHLYTKMWNWYLNLYT